MQTDLAFDYSTQPAKLIHYQMWNVDSSARL